MKTIIELESENLTNLGHMGSETTTNWRRFFKTVGKAKEAAEKDYGKPIKWSRGSRICSGDLGYVMYHITKVKVGE